MKLDFKHLSIAPALPPGTDDWVIAQVPVTSLRAIILTGPVEAPVRSPSRLEETPHFAFLQTGDRAPYETYMRKYGELVGFGKEHGLMEFARLARSFRYLAPPFQDEYIAVVKRPDETYEILDGVHRAALLAARRETAAPVVICNVANAAEVRLNVFVQSFKEMFPEWYTPIAFDDATVIHERTYPEFRERPEFLTNRERGQAKWDYIIKDNLPDVEGKTVYDLGCNVGLYALLLAQAGASRVVGMDRNEETIQPTNPNLPRQNVVQQAYFVRRAFELQHGRKFDNVEFVEADISRFDFAACEADVLFSTCVLYHFGAQFPAWIKSLPERTRTVFLQTNLGHKGPLASWTSLDVHETILREAGFERIRVCAPEGYKYPVISGERL